MNRLGVIISVSLVLVTSIAEAGRVYGSLQVDGKAAPLGTELVFQCPDKSYPTTVGKHGRYSVSIGVEGACTLTVKGYENASIDIVSYKDATRYNFLLSRSGGVYKLVRK